MAQDITNKLIDNFDAADWASEFVKIANKIYLIELDEGWMISWFAAAIMTGHDVAARKFQTKPVQGIDREKDKSAN